MQIFEILKDMVLQRVKLTQALSWHSVCIAALSGSLGQQAITAKATYKATYDGRIL